MNTSSKSEATNANPPIPGRLYRFTKKWEWTEVGVRPNDIVLFVESRPKNSYTDWVVFINAQGEVITEVCSKNYNGWNLHFEEIEQ